MQASTPIIHFPLVLQKWGVEDAAPYNSSRSRANPVRPYKFGVHLVVQKDAAPYIFPLLHTPVLQIILNKSQRDTFKKVPRFSYKLYSLGLAALNPTPQMVEIYSSLSSSFWILERRLLMWTLIVLSSPRYAPPHTVSKIFCRVNTLLG